MTPPKNTPANASQVGGDHYKTALEHWDFVVLNNLNYLEGNATKYLSRAEKKAGLQDYQKALHYIQKLREVHAAWQRRAGILRWVATLFNVPWASAWDRRGKQPAKQLHDFLAYNGVPATPGLIVDRIVNWQSDEDLMWADLELKSYIKARFLPT